MKKLLITLLVGILLISFVGAMDWDNKGTYDEATRTIVIENWLGFGDKIAEIELKSDLNVYVPRGYQKVAEFEVRSYDDYADALKLIEFYDVSAKSEGISRSYDLKYLTTKNITVDDYKDSCYIAANLTEVCDRVKSGSHQEEVESWEAISKDMTKNTIIRIGIFTDVQKGDVVEWIPTFYGVEIDEWATWTASLNVNLEGYWKLDGVAGVVADSLGVNHGVTSAARGVAGIIGNAFDFNAAAKQQVNVSDFDLTTGLTMSVWVRPDAVGAYNGIMGQNAIGSWCIDAGVATTPRIRLYTGAGAEITNFATPLQVGVWQHYAWTWNGTTVMLYKNGSLETENGGQTNGAIDTDAKNYTLSYCEVVGTDWLDGKFDEAALWSRALSASEISDLWNGGAGITYSAAGAGVITLNSPIDNYESVNLTQVINCSGNMTDGAGIDNVTVWHNSTGVWHLNDTIDTSGAAPTYYEAIFYIDDLNKTEFKWTCKADSNISNEFWSTANRTITLKDIVVISESYSAEVLEKTSSLFTANISIAQVLTAIGGNLTYNFTVGAGNFVAHANNHYLLSRTQTAPIVDIETNVTFFWTVTFDDFSTQTTPTNNQSVLNLGIDDCAVFTVPIFNFTLVDEDSQDFLTGATFNTSMNIHLSLSNPTDDITPINFSQNYTKINPALICLESNLSASTFRVDAIVEYSATDKFVEFYNIQNFILTNQTTDQNITLYDLNSSKGQEFKITYRDDNFDFVPEALVQIQRQYISEGVFKTVEISKIGGQGYAVGHLIVDDNIYNLIIIKEGVILATFNNVVANCQNPSLQVCEININSFGNAVPITSFSGVGDFNATLSYNRATRVITSIFVVPSGASATVSLNVTLFDTLGNWSVCDDLLTAAGGTLSCVVPASFGNATVLARVYSDGDLQRSALFVLSPSGSGEVYYGSSLVFLALIMMLTLIGISITDNPTVHGVMLILGFVVLTVLNLLTPTSWIGEGAATVLWFVIAIVIILIKRGNRD